MSYFPGEDIPVTPIGPGGGYWQFRYFGRYRAHRYWSNIEGTLAPPPGPGAGYFLKFYFPQGYFPNVFFPGVALAPPPPPGTDGGGYFWFQYFPQAFFPRRYFPSAPTIGAPPTLRFRRTLFGRSGARAVVGATE